MTDNIFNLFCILKGKTELTRRPVQTFIAKNYTDAKLYFQGYLLDEENGTEYTLYKIAQIEKNLKLYPCKIFICGGFETKEQQKEDFLADKIRQCRLNIEKFKKINEERKEKELTQSQIIERIFEGRKINE